MFFLFNKKSKINPKSSIITKNPKLSKVAILTLSTTDFPNKLINRQLVDFIMSKYSERKILDFDFPLMGSIL